MLLAASGDVDALQTVVPELEGSDLILQLIDGELLAPRRGSWRGGRTRTSLIIITRSHGIEYTVGAALLQYRQIDQRLMSFAHK